MGFTRARATSSAIVRGWHHGRYPAVRSERARELLPPCSRRCSQALAATADPDAAFIAFDGFLAGLPAGVQLFSLMEANPTLLDLLVDIWARRRGSRAS